MSDGDAISGGSRLGPGVEQAVGTRLPVAEFADHHSVGTDPDSYIPEPEGSIEEGTSWLGAALVRSRAQVARLVRYGATSGMAFCLSEATLLILYGSHLVGATTAALIANVVATVPSYLMSRYWIWKDADRTRVGRQVVLYWATSAASIVLTSLATGAIAHHIPTNHRFHLALVGLAFLVVNVVFFLLKFVVYHKIIFRTQKSPEGVTVSSGP